MNAGSVAPAETDTFVVAGFSQSAVVASLVKADLVARYQNHPQGSPEVAFSFIANPMRGNGGILMRFNKLTIPIIDIPMYGATPTSTCQDDGGLCYPSIDIAQQYDFMGGDAPNNLFNILALVNSIAGYTLLHGQMQSQDLGDAEYQDTLGGTDYYLKPAELLPVLMPLERLGVPRATLLVADAPLRVLIEDAYRRDINPGEPTPQYLVSISRPVVTAANALRAIPVGIDDGLQEAGFPRLLGTRSAGKYGVEGGDENLKGLPAGFLPLGSTDPMPSTPSAETDEAAVQRFTESDQPAPVDVMRPPTPQSEDENLKGFPVGLIPLGSTDPMPSAPSAETDEAAVQRFTESDQRAPVDVMRPPTPQSDADDLDRHGTERPDPVRDLPDMLQPNDSGQDQLDDRQRSTVPSSTLRSDEQPIGEVSKSPRRQWPEPDEKKESSGAAQADEAA
jgi:hypothetical protein